MTRSVFLLAICIIMLSIIKQNKSSRNTKIVRIDFVEVTYVKQDLTIHVPRSLKFGDKVVNPKYSGTIVLRLGRHVYEYKRPLDYSRNEYVLTVNTDREVNLEAGDCIIAEFEASNLTTKQNITLFAEKEV